MNRTQNAIRNIFFGMLLRLYQTIMPFAMRTVMIYTLGVEYLGLNGLFASVLQVLNIAELGISGAMTVSMYEPIVKNDTKKLRGLLSLYRKYYIFVGLIILGMGLLLLPFLPHLISGEIPQGINIYCLFLMYLTSTVLSYTLFSYRSSLFEAYQRNDMISKIQIGSSTLQFALQIVFLLIFKNYYLYIIVQFMVQLMNQFLLYVYAKKVYPDLYPVDDLDKELQKSITKKIKDLATARFGSIILHSSDTIVISMFLGLAVLAIYQNYFYLITSVCSFIAAILYGVLAGIGNSLVVETKEKNLHDFKKFTFIIAGIVCVCTNCFLCLFQPFMELWMGVERMLPFSMVILFCIYFFLYEYNQLFNLYKDAAGLWHKDRFRPLITSLANLFLNIVLVQYIGIYGIILSTIISMLFIGMPWLLHNLFSTLFEQKMGSYLKELLKYLLATLLSSVLSYVFTSLLALHGVLALIVNGMIAVGVSCVVFLFFFRKNEYLRYTIKLAKKIIMREKN